MAAIVMIWSRVWRVGFEVEGVVRAQIGNYIAPAVNHPTYPFFSARGFIPGKSETRSGRSPRDSPHGVEPRASGAGGWNSGAGFQQ